MTFAISGGAVTSLYKPTAAPVSSLRLADSYSSTYAQMWKAQPNIRTAVSFLARNAAQLGLHTFRRTSDLDRERVTDHPLTVLLGRPSPWMTQYRFVESLVSDIGIYDNSIWLKAKLPDQPMTMVRLDPALTTPVGKNPFYPEAYKIGKTELKPEQVVHFRGYSPLDSRWGVSPMETLRQLLAEDYQASLHREQLWRNGARTSGFLKRPVEAPPWTHEAKERFRAQWRAQYTGDGSQVGGTPILEDGMEFVPASMAPKDAQYIEARKLTREEVAAAYHIPLPLVGILDHATYSNIREQHKMLYQDTLGPLLQMIQQDLELQLFPDFGDTESLYVEFNIAEKLRGSFEEQATQLQTATGRPWMTANEARARVNLPQLPDGDELAMPLNLTAGAADVEQTGVNKDQALVFGTLIRAGVTPEEAARLSGMGSVRVIEGTPVTFRPAEAITPGSGPRN